MDPLLPSGDPRLGTTALFYTNAWQLNNMNMNPFIHIIRIQHCTYLLVLDSLVIWLYASSALLFTSRSSTSLSLARMWLKGESSTMSLLASLSSPASRHFSVSISSIASEVCAYSQVLRGQRVCSLSRSARACQSTADYRHTKCVLCTHRLIAPSGAQHPSYEDNRVTRPGLLVSQETVPLPLQGAQHQLAGQTGHVHLPKLIPGETLGGGGLGQLRCPVNRLVGALSVLPLSGMSVHALLQQGVQVVVAVLYNVWWLIAELQIHLQCSHKKLLLLQLGSSDLPYLEPVSAVLGEILETQFMRQTDALLQEPECHLVVPVSVVEMSHHERRLTDVSCRVEDRGVVLRGQLEQVYLVFYHAPGVYLPNPGVEVSGVHQTEERGREGLGGGVIGEHDVIVWTGYYLNLNSKMKYVH